MKKTLQVLMITWMITALTAHLPALSQGTNFSRKFSINRPGANLTVSTAAIPVAMVHDRALKEFRKTNPLIVGETWARIKSGFMVIYYEQEIRHHSYYNKKGHWETTIRYLNQTQIPSYLISAVQYCFPGFAACAAQEFEMPHEKFHLLYVENGKNYKRLRFTKDQLELLTEGIK